MTDWTEENSRAAEAEGWDIFDSEGSVNGPRQLQAFDEPELWPGAPQPYPFPGGDPEVWAHVRRRAGEGSPLHIHALEFLREHNPQEYDAITGEGTR